MIGQAGEFGGIPCSEADDGPWRQAEVLQEPRVQLGDGLDCTKEKPTSMPTTRQQSTLPFHPAVGRQGRWGTRGKKTRLRSRGLMYSSGFGRCRACCQAGPPYLVGEPRSAAARRANTVANPCCGPGG